jgi:hypothetical protein
VPRFEEVNARRIQLSERCGCLHGRPTCPARRGVLGNSYYWGWLPLSIEFLGRTGRFGVPLGEEEHPFFLRATLSVFHSLALRVRFTSSSRIRLGDPYDRSVTSGTWHSIVPDEQMLKQCVNPSVSLATQLNIFLKGKVSTPPNLFSFSKRRDGISLELVKFFAHCFAL